MSAQAVFAPRVHHKDQMKLMRAETAAAWTVDAFKWVGDVLTQPLSPEFDLGDPPRRQDFPAFPC